MASALPPVSKEQAFLETYFQCLQKFAYDKAKELSVSHREDYVIHNIIKQRILHEFT